MFEKDRNVIVNLSGEIKDLVSWKRKNDEA